MPKQATRIVRIHGYVFEANEDAVIIGAEGGEIPDDPIVVQRNKWRGEERLDVRRYYWNEGKGRWCRTRKGAPIPLTDVDEFLSVCTALCPEIFEE